MMPRPLGQHGMPGATRLMNDGLARVVRALGLWRILLHSHGRAKGWPLRPETHSLAAIRAIRACHLGADKDGARIRRGNSHQPDNCKSLQTQGSEINYTWRVMAAGHKRYNRTSASTLIPALIGWTLG